MEGVQYVPPPDVSTPPRETTIEYVYATQAGAPMTAQVPPVMEMKSVAKFGTTDASMGKDIEVGLKRTEDRLRAIDKRLCQLEGRRAPLLGGSVNRTIKPKTEKQTEAKKKMDKKDHKFFWKNLELALRVAVWVTLFGLPTYHDYFINVFFGQPDAASKEFCGNNLGRFYNNSGTMEPFQHQHGDDIPVVQCGILPDIYKGYWPTVGMMIIFSVYQNLGMTVRLCWQGIIGTFWAVVNNVVMCVLFPKGAAGDHYWPVLAWFDVILIVVLFLVCNAETNTIKFGLSTHICLMIEFMTPGLGPTMGEIPMIGGVNWDNEAVCWLLTAIIGALVAVLACLLPYPLTNITEVDDICVAYVLRASKIFHCCVNYMCGPAMTPEGEQLACRILKLNENLVSMKGQNDAAWWETGGLTWLGLKKQQMYGDFEEVLSRLQSVMTTIRRTVRAEDFKGQHKSFMSDSIQKPLNELCDCIEALAEGAAKGCEDGNIDDKEKEDLEKLILDLEVHQKTLVEVYLNQSSQLKGGMRLKEDLGAEHTFLFCLVTWGHRLRIFVKRVLFHHKAKPPSMKDHMKQAMLSIKETWEPATLKTTERILYTVRNTLTIMIAYVLAMELKDKSLFTQYSSTMPMTLTMLISRQPGTTFFNSTQRLMGVTLGKVLPLLMVGMANLFTCEDWKQYAWHMSSSLGFELGFLYMYFTSMKYAGLGCFAAAYGCAFLFVPCSNSNFEATYSARYKELGQICCAIVIQQMVDVVFSFKQDPRNQAIAAVKNVKEQLKKGYGQFFKQDQFLMDDYDDIKKAIAGAEQWVSECDPQLEVCPGWETPFNVNLYASCVDTFHVLLGDFLILALGAGEVGQRSKGHTNAGDKGLQEKADEEIEASAEARQKSRTDDDRLRAQGLVGKARESALAVTASAMFGFQSINVIEQQLYKKIDQAFDTLLILLGHTEGTKIKDRAISEVTYIKDLRTLHGLNELIANCNSMKTSLDEQDFKKDYLGRIPDVRLAVAIHGLDSASNTLADLIELVTEHNTTG
mmetsp:Transcript_90586/g.157224  ORF Transcript_90586/g.157224 Transcript_90586/m.157224 type:complete len:1027 (-) Transcript_90586:66-3146(-)